MIISFKDLSDVRRRHAGKAIVYGSGCFDLLHPGHLEMLQVLASFGDVTVVSVANDVRVREKKGPTRPVNDQNHRLKIIDSIRYVDYSLVVPPTCGNRHGKFRLLEALRPDVFVTYSRKWEKYRDFLESIGVNLVVPPMRKQHSTTRIIGSIVSKHKSFVNNH